MELSQKLKELRKKQGLTQLELAERLFVSRQAISGWEAGTSRPSTENLQSLSRLFNIPLETLLDDSAEAEPAAAQEKLPAEEQAKEEDKGQGKARRYGTALMAEVVGKMPDLQAAIGTNDQEGYVRTSDLSHPKFETPQDALEWQKTQPDSYYIPLYDFQGNEIGSFLRERNNLTIAEMEAMKG